jgi:hypothetical protein
MSREKKERAAANSGIVSAICSRSTAANCFRGTTFGHPWCEGHALHGLIHPRPIPVALFPHPSLHTRCPQVQTATCKYGNLATAHQVSRCKRRHASMETWQQILHHQHSFVYYNTKNGSNTMIRCMCFVTCFLFLVLTFVEVLLVFW